MLTLIISLAALFGLVPAPARAEPDFRARIVSVGDGDTLRVRRGQQLWTIRLACIDAPEMAQGPYGERARRYLQTRLPQDHDVTIHPLGTDRYGRTVAEVISEINLNLALVEDGEAFVYPKYLGQCDANEYLQAEYRARRHRYGIWQVPGGIERPWEFRQGRQTPRPQKLPVGLI